MQTTTITAESEPVKFFREVVEKECLYAVAKGHSACCSMATMQRVADNALARIDLSVNTDPLFDWGCRRDAVAMAVAAALVELQINCNQWAQD